MVLLQFGVTLEIKNYPTIKIEVNNLLSKLVNETLGEYWAKPQIPYIIAGYPDLLNLLPFKHKERLYISMTKQMTVEDYLNYTATWSAWTTVEKIYPGRKKELLDQYQKDLLEAGNWNLNSEINILWPINLFLARELNG